MCPLHQIMRRSEEGVSQTKSVRKLWGTNSRSSFIFVMPLFTSNLQIKLTDSQQSFLWILLLIFLGIDGIYLRSDFVVVVLVPHQSLIIYRESDHFASAELLAGDRQQNRTVVR